MLKKYVMRAQEAGSPILTPVTKLGGQPVWLAAPQWPLSKALGVPMGFIGQFEILPDVVGACEARMAYLFMTDTIAAVETWLPDGGENAVVLQPGSYDGPSAPLETGPTLHEAVFDEHRVRQPDAPCEYRVMLEAGEDPEGLDEDSDEYAALIDESKIGGVPGFFQSPEYPGPGNWRLLAQLDAGIVPAGPNFGDAGIGYLFLSEDGRVGKFLWQCA